MHIRRKVRGIFAGWVVALFWTIFFTTQSPAVGFSAPAEDDVEFGSLDLEKLNLSKIRAIADQESDIWRASTKDSLPEIGTEELAGLNGFAQKLFEWYKKSNGTALSTPRQLLESLLATAFDEVFGKSASSLTDDLLKDAAAVKADPTASIPQISEPEAFTITYGRLFVVQYGLFLADGLKNAVPQKIEDVRAMMQKAMYRGRVFALCVEKVKWLSSNPSSPQANKFNPATLGDLLGRCAKLEEALLPKLDDDASRARLSADLVSAAVDLESELLERVGGIDGTRSANPSAEALEPHSENGAAADSDSLIRPARAPRLRFIPYLVPSSDGSPLYRLELSVERPLPATRVFLKKESAASTESQENTPVADKQVPETDYEEQILIGYTVYGVRKNGRSWFVAGEPAKANASFDSRQFRKYLTSLGVPLALISEQAEHGSNLSLSVDPKFTTLAVAFTLRVPEIRFSGISTVPHEQRVSINLKIGDDSGNVDQALLAAFQSAKNALVRDFEKDLSEKLNTLSNKVSFTATAVKNAGWDEGVFAYDFEAREPGGRADTGKLFTLRITFDPSSGNVSVHGLQVEDRLRGKLREAIKSNLRPIAGDSTERLCSYAHIGGLTARNDQSDGPTLEATFIFDLAPLAETVPSICVTYQPLVPDAVPKCNLVTWKDWAKGSLKVIDERISSLIQGFIQNRIDDLDKKEFTICQTPRITAAIKNSRYLSVPKNAYEMDLVLSIGSHQDNATGSFSELILQHVRLIGGYNETTHSLQDPKFDLTQCKIKEEGQLQKRIEEVLNGTLTDSKLHVSDLRVGGFGLSFNVSVNVPELGLTVETGELTIRLDGHSPDFIRLVTDTLRQVLESKLLNNLPTIGSLGPLEDVSVDSDKSQISTDGQKQRFELWLKAKAKVWKELKVPVLIRVFPTLTIQKGDTSELFSQVTELLQSDWNLPGGFALKKAEGQELFDLDPLQINLDVSLDIPPIIGVSVKGIHVSRHGISGANDVRITSDILADTLVPAVSTASETWVFLYDPSLIVSLANAGSVGIGGKFCINNRATAEVFYMDASLMANFASSQGLSFDLKGQLWFFTRFPLFDLTGTINLREAKAECEGKTGGFFAKVLDADLSSRMSFKEGSYNQNARIAVFGLHLGKANLKVSLKGQPSAEADADVDLPLLGHADGTFRAQIAAKPLCELTVKLALKIIGIDLGDSVIDINLHRTRLACHALGCRVIILAPNIESLTPNLIARYLKSIFHLSWPDFKALVKREIILGPDGKTSSRDDDLNQVAPNGLQNQNNPPANRLPGPGPSPSGGSAVPDIASGANPGPTVMPSPPPIISTQLVLAPSGTPCFASAKTLDLLKIHPRYRQLPAEVQMSGGKAVLSYEWSSQPPRVYSLIACEDDHKIYPISFDDQKATADTDNEPLNPLPVTEADLFPATSPSSASLESINRRLLGRALESVLNKTDTQFNRRVVICPPATSPANQFAGIIYCAAELGDDWEIDRFGPGQEVLSLSATEADLLKECLPGPSSTTAEKRIYLQNLLPVLGRGYALKSGGAGGSLWFSLEDAAVIPFDSARSVFTFPLIISKGSSWDKAVYTRKVWSFVLGDLLEQTKTRAITASGWSVLMAIDDQRDQNDTSAAIIGWFDSTGEWEVRAFKIAKTESTADATSTPAAPVYSDENSEDFESSPSADAVLTLSGVVDGAEIKSRFQSFAKFSDWARKLDLTKKADQVELFKLFMSAPDEWSEHFGANPIGLLSK